MRTGVVIVNYNCARYALDAALSALGDGADRVIIVDNGSRDSSRQYFEDVWAGRLVHGPETINADPAPAYADLAHISKQLVDDPAVMNGSALTVIFEQNNRGFAAGCNIGLRALIIARACDQYILLNPDAVLAVGAIAAFGRRLADPKTGLCGATVLRQAPPHCAQAFAGARLDPVTLLGNNIGAGKMLGEAPPLEAVEDVLDYPLGAAMACRSDYIDTAGFLDERFFLYYEEADWARAGAAQYRSAWAREAVVYHRHGAAAGSRREGGGRSALADYHMARSRILYAAKWRPVLLPLLVMAGVVQAVRRLLRGHWRQAKAVISGSLPGASRDATLDF